MSSAALASLEEEFSASDVDAAVKLYDQIGLRSNIMAEVVEHIDR